MANDYGIVLSARDNYTSTIVKVKTATKGFSNDLTGLAEKLKLLDKTKLDIGISFDKSKKELSEAKKALASAKEGTDAFADAMRRAQDAQMDFNNMQSQIRVLGTETRSAEGALNDLLGTASKVGNRAGGIMGIAGVAAAAQYVGGIATQGLSIFTKSASGNMGGMYVDSIMGGATSGAAIGSLIAPGIGTAIGALAGGALGVVQGKVKEFEMEDDAFKGSVQNLYDTSTGKATTDLQAGSGIAAGRETDLISFSTLFKDKGKASDFLGEVKDMANETPFLYEDLTAMGKVLKANRFEDNSLLPTMTAIGDAGAALGIDSNGMKMVATALGRMKLTDKPNIEYLNIMLERGINVYKYLADAGGVSEETLMSMISKGEVSGDEAAQAIVDYMGAEFKNSMLEQSKTYSGMMSNVEGLTMELQNAQGEGYTESRKGSLSEQANWLGGTAGVELQGIYSEIGKWQAELENKKDAVYREVMDSMRNNNEEYKKAKAEGDGATLYKLIASAEAQAETAWALTDEYQQAKAANLGIVDEIQLSTQGSENYYKDSLVYQNKLSEGVASVNARLNTGNVSPSVASAVERRRKVQGYAWGLDRVPHDNYPAMLHEGERVLTANQARQQSGGQGVSVYMNGVTVREDADIDRIASELVHRLQLAKMVAN